MTRKTLAICLLLATGIFPVAAQTHKESFEEFRKSIKDNYNTFRKQALDNYSEFLEGIWKEYTSFTGKERDNKPKPQTPPHVNPEPRKEEPTIPPVNKDIPKKEPIPPKAPTTPPSEEPAPKREPITPAGRTFAFYSTQVIVPRINWNKNLPSGMSPDEISSLWKIYSKMGVEKQILPILSQYKDKHKLNDWFMFELIRAYCDSEFAGNNLGWRITLTHYLLVHSGYNAKLALTTDTSEPFLLVNLKQMVYSRAYFMENNNKFYVFYDTASKCDHQQAFNFYTYKISENVDCGKSIDLHMDNLPAMPMKAHCYKITHDGLTIEGEVNANIMPMLFRYPQMEIGDYAGVCETESQRHIAAQLKGALDTLPRHEAVDKLLGFVQKAFEYATDDDQHGFEKPYFFEEMLFYPKCDCEDRSIFYSYLLKAVLGVENHIVNYPGHEAVYVNLGKQINGHGYLYDKKRFYVSDPTYIGAVTGMCMEQYENEKPRIDFMR